MRALSPCVLLLLAGAAGAEPPKVGDVVYASSFEEEAERVAWPAAPFAEWVVDGEVNHCLEVVAPADEAPGSHMISIPLDLTPWRGCRLLLTCRAKAEDVSKPSQTYLGVKFMLHYTSASAGPWWGNENDLHGSFDWRALSFTASIPADAEGGQLSLGLQDSTGTVRFDDIRITVSRAPRPARPEPRADAPPPFTGRRAPGLRGVMSPNEFRDEDLRKLGEEWNANLIRWQMTRNWGATGTERDLEEYDEWYAAEMVDLDRVLEACRRYGIQVVVDMHSPCGGRYANSDLAIFHEPLYQDHWIELWRQTAERLRGNPVIWAYDLVNEPVQNGPSPEGVADWLGAQVRAARAIREVDPETPILIEACDWDGPSGYRELDPVDVRNVIYQVHMYEPGAYTHQGVYENPRGATYPGTIGSEYWDKETIRRHLQPVREFQLAYNVHIYAGEFSAIRWAPGAAQYLGDLTDIFEEYGWDWTYHAYREWDGWSLEHGPDSEDHTPTAEPTDRLQVILDRFARNEKPRL